MTEQAAHEICAKLDEIEAHIKVIWRKYTDLLSTTSELLVMTEGAMQVYCEPHSPEMVRWQEIRAKVDELRVKERQ
jgi:hypothetical protein